MGWLGLPLTRTLASQRSLAHPSRSPGMLTTSSVGTSLTYCSSQATSSIFSSTTHSYASRNYCPMQRRRWPQTHSPRLCHVGLALLVVTRTSLPLSDKYNRLLPQDFVPWTRRFLQLPPLSRLGNATAVADGGFDYEMETCLGSHSEGSAARLDLYGSHDNSNCGPTALGKHSGHTWLKWAVNRYARRVPGVRCVVEPKTHLILNSQFTEEQCHRLFPKAPSKDRIEQIRKLIDEMDQIQSLPPGDTRTRRQRDLSASINALNTASNSEKKKAVRLDVQLQHGGDELLVDCTIIHPLAGCHLRAEAKRTLERLNSSILEVKNKPAAAIETARRKKEQAYTPLVYVLKRQRLEGRRHNEPVFTPMAVTSFGELGPGCTVVQEWLAMRLKAHHTAFGDRPDGLQAADLTKGFRKQFRMAILMVTIRRLGAMQRDSGLPDRCAWGRWGFW